MTFDQAQLYIKIFIFQHYDKNIEDVIPQCAGRGKVSDLYTAGNGVWNSQNNRTVFWASKDRFKQNTNIGLQLLEIKKVVNDFNILDYISLEEESL